jgi:hypothetical protein
MAVLKLWQRFSDVRRTMPERVQEVARMRQTNSFGENGSISLKIDGDRVSARFEPPKSLEPSAIRDSIGSIVHGADEQRSIPLNKIVLTDDTVAIPVFGRPDVIGQIIVPLIAELGKAGVPETAIQVICRNVDAADYRELLGGTVSVVVHDPDQEEKTAYLANSVRGSRLYLNREMLDCDVIVPVIVPEPGGQEMRMGLLSGFWPEFSRSETRGKIASDLRSEPRRVRGEIREVAWLAGLHLVIVGIPGPGGVAALSAVPPFEAQSWARERFGALWKFDFGPDADSILLQASDPDGLSGTRLFSFLRLARQLAARYRRIVLCTRFGDDVIASMEQELRSGQKSSPSWLISLQKIGRIANVSFLGNLPDEVADDCEIVLLEEPADLQRQIDHSGQWIVVPEAWGVWPQFGE